MEARFGDGPPRLFGKAAHLSPPSSLKRGEARGEADAFALHRKYHDPACPSAKEARQMGDKARALFDAAEEARVESLGAIQMRGVAENLQDALRLRLRRMKSSAPPQRFTADDEAGFSEMAFGLLVREILTGAPSPREGRHLLERWGAEMRRRAAQTLPALEKVKENQAAFAKALKEVLRDMGFQDEMAKEEKREQETEGDEEKREDAQSDGETASSPDSQEAPESEEGDDSSMEQEAETEDSDGSPEAEEAAPHRRREGQRAAAEALYSVFSMEFDEIVDAETLSDADELSRLRRDLDRQLEHFHGLVTRLAHRLQRHLMAQQKRSWVFDLEEGHLDSARLARILSEPLTPLIYKIERESVFRDTVVSLLLDNSGSMRGRPIAVAALCADILGRTLERCGVGVEILGFTTRRWKGGRVREKWLAAQKPPRPGRLNELRHIIYKSADTPWRRARRNLGLMMKEGILKENIDGEALLWAHQRLLARREERRILMVISDGAPVDDATLSANAANYLERHLRLVIADIEKRSPVELLAIGIGHDVTRYYRRAVTIVDAEQLGGAMIGEMVDLFQNPPAPRASWRGDRGAASRMRRAL